MAHVKADFSLSYYDRAETALTKFVAYLKENNLYDKPISEITVRDVQVFFNRYTQKTYTKNLMVRLIKPLPPIVKGSEVNRKGVISSNAFYKLKHGKAIRRDAVERLCAVYGLDINVYFEEVDSDKKKYAFETVNGYRKVLSTVFEEAVRYDWVSKNPVRYTKLSNIFANEIGVNKKDIFTLTEAKEFIKHLDELPRDKIYMKVVLKFMILTGVRKAEMCGLRWSDIDFEDKIVHIRRNRLYGKNVGVYEKGPKTKSSRLDIPLPDALIEDLKIYMLWFEEADKDFYSKLDTYYLAVNPLREPINPFTIIGWLNSIEDKYGMKHISPRTATSILFVAVISGRTDTNCKQVYGTQQFDSYITGLQSLRSRYSKQGYKRTE